MIEIKRKGRIEFGVWKYLQKANNQISPVFACVQPMESGALINQPHGQIVDVGTCVVVPPQPIGCEGATNTAAISVMTAGSYYNVSVNGVELDNPIYGDNLGGALDIYRIVVDVENDIGTFTNNSDQLVQLEIEVSDASAFQDQPTDNPTVVFSNEDSFGAYSKVKFCLAPQM